MSASIETIPTPSADSLVESKPKKTSALKNYARPLIIVLLGSVFLRIFSIFFNDLIVEEAYYWNYAQHLDFGYLDHPPMVAVLIKLSTLLFGHYEFAIRLPTLFCWGITAFFSYRLTQLVAPGSARYAVMLLAVLPFFFLHSLVITPDQPLTAAWSASLYFLYRALVFNETKPWYAAGFWMGLGLLSKYTIVLLGPAALLYIAIAPKSRQWLKRKEPYLGLVIALLCFTPVIYWNATHQWASFAFQSTRRFHSTFSFSLLAWLGLLLFFLMPIGILGLWQLIYPPKKIHSEALSAETKRFLKTFSGLPLFFFGVFSLFHAIKFNWIGPGLLAIIPWLAYLMTGPSPKARTIRAHWIITSTLLLIAYAMMIASIATGRPTTVYNALFTKYIAWNTLTVQLNRIAKQVESESFQEPTFVPLDLYNIGSELAFYQTKLFTAHKIGKIYPIVGRHIFGSDSLMYQYWSPTLQPSQTLLILVTSNPEEFDNANLKQKTTAVTPIQSIQSYSQGKRTIPHPYYYQIVRVKPD